MHSPQAQNRGSYHGTGLRIHRKLDRNAQAYEINEGHGVVTEGQNAPPLDDAEVDSLERDLADTIFADLTSSTSTATRGERAKAFQAQMTAAVAAQCAAAAKADALKSVAEAAQAHALHSALQAEAIMLSAARVAIAHASMIDCAK